LTPYRAGVDTGRMRDRPTRDPPAASPPGYHRVISREVDQSADVLRRYYVDSRLSMERDPSAPYVMRADVLEFGPLTIGCLTFPSAMSFDVPCVNGYYVAVPLHGAWRSTHPGGDIHATPGRTAGVVCPDRQVTVGNTRLSRTFQVKIERNALEENLAMLLDRPVRGPVDLAGELDIRTGAGQAWAQLITLLGDESQHQDSLIYQPLIAERLWSNVISGLLLAVSHPWHDELIAPAATAAPRAVRRVVDAIESEPDLPYTVGDLARIAGVSVRSLHDSYRRYLGTTPMLHLRQVRLARSHVALQHADPRRITVAAVAHRWGFAHLGRFAQVYRARYGESPSTTLRYPYRHDS
jgi:AraC-like DNA-binding protein